MKIELCLFWDSTSSRTSGRSKGSRSLFKHRDKESLVDEYVSRVAHFAPCRIVKEPGELGGRTMLWMCDRGTRAKVLSSEQIAVQLEKTLGSSRDRLLIMIGGPNGYTEADLKKLNPDLLWCFGPMTLPHELAAVVASEQLYRAFSILRGLPYHSAH